jgi:DNA-binding NarL/FixJ family response regulator
MHVDLMLEAQMYEVGAYAYLSKGTAFNVICDTIRQVRSGDRPAEKHSVS